MGVIEPNDAVNSKEGRLGIQPSGPHSSCHRRHPAAFSPSWLHYNYSSRGLPVRYRVRRAARPGPGCIMKRRRNNKLDCVLFVGVRALLSLFKLCSLLHRRYRPLHSLRSRLSLRSRFTFLNIFLTCAEFDRKVRWAGDFCSEN